MWPVLILAGIIGAVAYAASQLTNNSSNGELSYKGKKVVLMGDSIAVGIAPFLAKWARVSGFSMYYDARAGRRISQQAIGNIKDKTVIVSLGSNDATSMNAGSLVRHFLSEVKEKEPAHVVFIVPPGGGQLRYMGKVKEAIRLESGIVPVCVSTELAKDGIHPKSYGLMAGAVIDTIKGLWKFDTIKGLG